MQADLVLVGRVLGGDPRQPRAGALAVSGGRIIAVGPDEEILKTAGPRARVVGDRSGALVPGFVDAHLHFVALARRRAEVDCSLERAASVAEILARVRDAAVRLPVGSWIRAFGYDEALLADRRAPTPLELEEAAPRHPVRLLHRTGHAAVLSRGAFRRLGLEERDTIFEPGEILRGRLPQLDPAEMRRLAELASERLLASGVTAFHDVTPGQDPSAIDRLRGWTRDRVIRQRVAAFGAAETFAGAREDGDRFSAPGVKIVITEESDAEEVSARVARADSAGAQVALHAVEGGPLVVAIDALARLGPERVRRGRHRIEHASLCPPPLQSELAACGATVVTHPSFLERFGAKYRREVDPGEQEWLYPLRSFREAGVAVALGSDAPIAPAEPLANVAAAVLREDGDGPLGGAQRISVDEALVLHTRSGAMLCGWGERIGSLTVGSLADVAVLDADPTAVTAREIAAIGVRATVVGGELAWARE